MTAALTVTDHGGDESFASTEYYINPNDESDSQSGDESNELDSVFLIFIMFHQGDFTQFEATLIVSFLTISTSYSMFSDWD